MKKFNKALNVDITELKTLYIKKDKTEFKKLKAEIMQKHNISKATVYREIAKEVPGSYRQPKYSNKAPEVTAYEKELVRIWLFRKWPTETICYELERTLRENYTYKRVDRIRKAIEQEDLEKAAPPPVTITVGEAAGEVKPLKEESALGKDLKTLLEGLLNIDKMQSDSYVTVIVKGREFKVDEETRRDISNKLANAADAEGKTMMDSIKEDIKHLLKEQLRSMKNGLKFGVRDLFDIRRMYMDMGGGTNSLNPIDFQLLAAVVQKFKPDAELDEIENVTDKLAEDFPKCSLNVRPDYLLMMDKTAEQARNNI